jgi:hypothetical protein
MTPEQWDADPLWPVPLTDSPTAAPDRSGSTQSVLQIGRRTSRSCSSLRWPMRTDRHPHDEQLKRGEPR